MAVCNSLKCHRICPPPEHPIENGSDQNWSIIEQQYGLILPPDFKQYITLYGTGKIADFLWVYNPFNQDYLNLNKENQQTLTADREIMKSFQMFILCRSFQKRMAYIIGGIQIMAIDYTGKQLVAHQTGQLSFMNPEDPNIRGLIRL
jgi:hypothetical protein